MRNDINDLKKLTLDLMKSGNVEEVQARKPSINRKNLRRKRRLKTIM